SRIVALEFFGYCQRQDYNAMNVLSMYALMGAYGEEGQEWVDELCQVLTENVNYGYDFITSNFDGVTLSKPQGTYMLYLDCSQWCREHGMSVEELLKEGIRVGVIWQDGRPFKQPDTIRMNLAVPFSMLQDAFDRLDRYVFRR
ncbi:MAG: aspartate aminotransferase, partial [Lachnospiraceae bacterium]|nr:aspartate aminotransferase [Lachnospiraceae bacterium]